MKATTQTFCMRLTTLADLSGFAGLKSQQSFIPL